MKIDMQYTRTSDIAIHVARNVMRFRRVKSAVQSGVQEVVRMKIQVSYLELAKEALSRGDRKAFWRAFYQHRRVMRKKKAAASTVAR